MIVVITTVQSSKDAERMSANLLRKRLCACVQTIPIKSKYWWKGKMAASKEHLLLIKTKDALYRPLEKEIRKTHTYENPEIVALPALFASRMYHSWVSKETGSTK